MRKEVLKGFKENYGRYPTATELQKLRPTLLEGLEEIVDQVHEFGDSFNERDVTKKAVSNQLAEWSGIKRNRYSKYKWELYRSDVELVLGDACCLAFDKSRCCYMPAFFVSNDDTDHVLLPVSTSLLLVGWSLQRNKEFDLNISEVNASSAALSQEFLVAFTKTPLSAGLFQLIGSRVDESVDAMVNR